MLVPSDDPATCLAEWSSRGPRYTSYPPATEFGPIAVERVRRELAQIGGSTDPASLYVHVPFCRSLCAYCGCNVIPTRDSSRGDGYVDQLATEMTLIAGRLFADLDDARSELKEGVLTLMIPKKPEAQSKKIAISSGASKS